MLLGRGDTSLKSSSRLFGFRLAGRYVAFETVSASSGDYDQSGIGAFDLASGRRTAGISDDPFRVEFVRLLLTPRGHLAFIRRAENETDSLESKALGRASRLQDRGATGTITGVSVDRDTLRWRHGDEDRSAQVSAR